MRIRAWSSGKKLGFVGLVRRAKRASFIREWARWGEEAAFMESVWSFEEGEGEGGVLNG